MPWSGRAECTPFVQQVFVDTRCVSDTARCWGHTDITAERCVEMDVGFLKVPAGPEGEREREKGGWTGGNRLVCKAVTGCAAAPWRPRRS